MALTLYGGARSRASMPRWYLEEHGIPYHWEDLDLQAGEHRQEAYTAINPFAEGRPEAHLGLLRHRWIECSER